MMFWGTRLPLLPAFLKYDPSEIFVLVGALTMGPLAGLAIEALKILLYFMIHGGSWIGLSANFLAGATLALTVGALYRSGAPVWRTAAAVVAGSLVMALVMAPANYYVFLPARGMVGQQALDLVLKGLIPFNFFKGMISGVLAAMVAWPVSHYLGAQPRRAA